MTLILTICIFIMVIVACYFKGKINKDMLECNRCQSTINDSLGNRIEMLASIVYKEKI